jgi:hypothetical protein
MAAGGEFERIEVEAEIHPKGHFILIPVGVKMREAKRERRLEKVHAPLSFHRDYQSRLWRRQIDVCRKQSAGDVAWAAAQINRVVADHRDPEASNILEADLLRAGGALSILGLDLSAYLGRGYDCLNSRFEFQSLPSYPCPVEIKKRSAGFRYQLTRYRELPRAVVLCLEHDLVNPPNHIDFIELPVLAESLS